MDQFHAFLFMKNKTAIIAIVITAVAAFVMVWIMKKQAAEARQISNDILQQFKTVDERLQRKKDSFERAEDSFKQHLDTLFHNSP